MKFLSLLPFAPCALALALLSPACSSGGNDGSNSDNDSPGSNLGGSSQIDDGSGGGGADGSGGSDGNDSSGGNDGAGGTGKVNGGTSTGCREDDDCREPGLPVCDPVQGCVACLFDWDCPADHRCDDRKCVERVTCTAESDCAGDDTRPQCDPVVGYCVECLEDGDCGDDHRCESSKCVPTESCVNTRDCTSGKVCDRALGVCVGCVADGDCGPGNACVVGACVPTCNSDTQCIGLGLLCDPLFDRCVECLGNADCPEVYHCGAYGECVLDVCEPGQSRCESESQLAVCNDAGSDYVNTTCASGSSCTEDDLGATCKDWLCTPSATECSGDFAQIIDCSSDGFAIDASSPCPVGEACRNGACAPVVCVADSHSCDGNSLKYCDPSGTLESVADTCNSHEFCNAEAGACEPHACTPDTPTCDGNIVRTCNSDGSAFVGDGVDCAATGQACSGGSCRDIVCTGNYACNGADLFSCGSNGTELVFQRSCAATSLCDAQAGRCNAPLCTPGAFVCDDETATRCNAEGSGYLSGGEDCSASGLVCDGGGCLPKICEPGARYCQGGSPQECGAEGTTTTQTDTCTTNEHCINGQRYCAYDLCTADSTVCDGNFATTCASDGSGPLPGGVDCSATSQVCENGACADVVCTPGDQSCVGEAVYECNALGTGIALEQSCTSAYFCEASGNTAMCVRDICTPTVTGCDGETIATCSSNGGAWESPGTDCSTAQQVCVFGACQDEEIGTQGTTSSSQSVSNRTMVTSFDVLTPRKLTELEFYGIVPGTQKVTWVVYEKRESSTTHDLVFQKVAAVSAPSAGWISSGPLDFTFEAGKRYAVGFHVEGNATVYYRYSSSTVSYLPAVSFARNPGNDYAPATGQPDTVETLYQSDYYKYRIRFTTRVAN